VFLDGHLQVSQIQFFLHWQLRSFDLHHHLELCNSKSKPQINGDS
jgi:hypothetical protein